MSESRRAVLIAGLAAIAFAALVGITSQPQAPVAVEESPTPAPTSDPTPTTTDAPSARPTATCRVLPTPNYGNQEPAHAPVNGQPSLGVPTLQGVVLVQIHQCRDIQMILRTYGLLGPATRYIDVAETDDTIANGATRWYRVAVVPGTESATVVELYRHPEDIEYVQLIPKFVGAAAGS